MKGHRGVVSHNAEHASTLFLSTWKTAHAWSWTEQNVVGIGGGWYGPKIISWYFRVFYSAIIFLVNDKILLAWVLDFLVLNWVFLLDMVEPVAMLLSLSARYDVITSTNQNIDITTIYFCLYIKSYKYVIEITSIWW